MFFTPPLSQTVTLFQAPLERDILYGRPRTYEKRAAENRRSNAALLRYVVTAANRWSVSGYQWMHKKDWQQEQQPLKPDRSMFSFG